eukprot:COSAG01_NODE_13909_length_1518_cov_23.911910_2_plen_165_part_00
MPDGCIDPPISSPNVSTFVTTPNLQDAVSPPPQPPPPPRTTALLYGLPTSGRVYATERDRLLLTQLPKPPPEGAGWPCRKMEYETCMYEIIAKYGRILMTIHTDDCDCILEDARDQKELLNIMDKMFSGTSLTVPNQGTTQYMTESQIRSSWVERPERADCTVA